MVRALENLGSDSQYLEYFGLTRPPFARLSDNSRFFHTDQYSLLMAHLANATEQSDCLVIICGADGSGKTTLLNRYIASLCDELCFASIDETCEGATQFYGSILRQLGFGDITGTLPELRRITKQFLIHRGMAGDAVLLMIDNAHLVNPIVLEQLRWISATKVDDRRVLSVVLAGNSDLVHIMDSPAMRQTKFHNHVQFNIRAYSGDEIANYIQHRLESAGGAETVRFSSDVYSLIYRYTGGIPSLINMLCDAVLSEAHELESRVITEELVRRVADNRRLLPHVIPLQGKGRRKTDTDVKLAQPDAEREEHLTATTSTSEEPLEQPTDKSETPDRNDPDLLARLSHLSVELGELRADRKRYLQTISRHDTDISQLREKLDVQTARAEKLASALEDRSDEADRLKNEVETSAGELESKVAALRDLDKMLEESQNECASLRPQAAALKHLETSVPAREAHVADLKAELAACSQTIMTLEASNKELESRDMVPTETDGITALASELQEVCQILTETQAQLTEPPTLIVQPQTASLDLAPPDNQLAERSPAINPNTKTEQGHTTIKGFEIVVDGRLEQVIEVADNASRMMIGRAEDCELRLNSEFVSRHHALISCTEQGIYLEDLNSFNGTMVNAKVINRCELLADDVVAIGCFRLRPMQRID